MIIEGAEYYGTQYTSPVIDLNTGQNVSVVFSSVPSVQTSKYFVIDWECKFSPFQETQTGTEGTISHVDYDNNEILYWNISSECDRVLVTSSQFNVEATYDFVTIGELIFTGSDAVSVVVGGSFQIVFVSDHVQSRTGFILNWSCSSG